LQNNAVDIYEDYFADCGVEHSADPPSSAIVTVFKDPHERRGALPRAANCVSWHPDGASKLVVAYSELGFQRQQAGMALGSCVFDVASPNAPECELGGLSQLVCAKYNLKDASLIGAGQYNGQFAVFDTRKGSAPAETTPVDVCHRCGQKLLGAWRRGAQPGSFAPCCLCRGLAPILPAGSVPTRPSICVPSLLCQGPGL
jgi:hypothetical protein